nr:hypothetical protein [Pandoravirus belohorizontensis]
MHTHTEKDHGGDERPTAMMARQRSNTSTATHGPAIGAAWLLDAASAWLAANKGARCPLRVALASLSNVIRDRLVATTDLRGPALETVRAATIELARSTPEILCTLVMCDLCVSWSRSLLASVRPRAAAGASPDFATLTACFAEASVAQKKADDPSPLYVVRIDEANGGDGAQPLDTEGGRESHDAADETRGREGKGAEDGGGASRGQDGQDGHQGGHAYCFANEATYAAYRYFLRHAWEGLAGVPHDWRRPLPGDVRGWLDSAMRMRDLALTLPQHRLCLPRGPTVARDTGTVCPTSPANYRRPASHDGGHNERDQLAQRNGRRQCTKAIADPWSVTPGACCNGADDRQWTRRPPLEAPAPASSGAAPKAAHADDKGPRTWASAARAPRRR